MKSPARQEPTALKRVVWDVSDPEFIPGRATQKQIEVCVIFAMQMILRSAFSLIRLFAFSLIRFFAFSLIRFFADSPIC